MLSPTSMILHAIPNLVKAAGTSVYCAELCAELDRQGVVTGIAVGSEPKADWCSTPPAVPVSRFDPGGPLPDAVHIHGIWLPFLHRVAAWANRRDIPVVVSPQGMLTPWGLGQRWWKKKLALAAYQFRDLSLATLLHATVDSEVEDIRRMGLRQPVVVAPFGIDIPPIALSSGRGFAADRSEAGRDRIALFISRVHPKKGLLHLVEAWARLKREAKGTADEGDAGDRWHLVIAGPDECDHKAALIAHARAAGLTVQEQAATAAGAVPLTADVVFAGPVYDAQKTSLYQSADLFVLPTHSENFGVVILEALACGVPVITTKGAPWERLENVGWQEAGGSGPARAGWWIDIGVDPLVETLRQAMHCPDDVLRRIGGNARRLAQEEYSWQTAGGRMKLAYDWLVHGGTVPECIRL